MTNEPQAIEVEVIAIDGVAPLATTGSHEETPRRWQDWQNWHGRIRKLDNRWWPLWVFLGVIAVALLLTVGVFVAIVFVIFRVLSGLVRAIFR